jgi:hypothetical protein
MVAMTWQARVGAATVSGGVRRSSVSVVVTRTFGTLAQPRVTESHTARTARGIDPAASLDSRDSRGCVDDSGVAPRDVDAVSRAALRSALSHATMSESASGVVKQKSLTAGVTRHPARSKEFKPLSDAVRVEHE